MSTINDKYTIQRLVSANGFYKDDPQVKCIYTYINIYNIAVYAIYYKEYILEESEFMLEPKLLWTSVEGLTPLGKNLL